MSVSLRCAVRIGVLIAAACTRDDAVPAINLEQLGSDWSGGRTDVTCRRTGPRGTVIDRVMDSEECQWPTVVRGSEWGTVVGSRDRVAGMQLLKWSRVVRDTSAVLVLRDSLAHALASQRLTEYTCIGSGRRWQHSTFGVEMSVGSASPRGQPQVLIVATRMPWALPAILCPNAPQIPRPRTGASSSATATLTKRWS